MEKARERISVARDEYEGLLVYLEGLGPEGWKRPSACQGWEVRDVVAHLIGTTDFQSRMILQGISGGFDAPSGSEKLSPGARTASIARQAVELRQRLSVDLLGPFVDHYGLLFKLLNSLTPEQLGLPTRHPIGPGGVVKVRTYIDLVTLETAIHGWDIRWASDPKAPLSARSVPVLMGYSEGWLRRILHPKLPAGEVQTFRFRVAGHRFGDLVAEGGEFRIEASTSRVPTAILSCDANTYLLIHFGRLSFCQALGEGRLTIEGDREAILRLDDWMAGV